MSLSAPEPELDVRLAFENREQAERHITKAVVHLRQSHSQGLQIEVRGQFIDRIEVWPTGTALAVMSIEEQLNLPTSAIVRISPPLADAYDVTVYTTAPDSVELDLALV
ncbi:MAG: hypothetical protein ACJ764_11270 [Solirubrobacteraceae bacterium]